MDIILDQYCIDDKNVNEVQLEYRPDLLLIYIKYIYLKNEYFDYYYKICKILNFYSMFMFIKELAVLISIIACFFIEQETIQSKYNETWDSWQVYQQFV